MAHVITDYAARGLDAAKLAVPNIGAGETGFYWATDTLKLYGWTGVAWTQVNTGVGGASIVQVKSAALANMSVGVTLGAAPTNGNLLVAFIADQAGAPTAGAGWVTLITGFAANDDTCIMIKLAGAGESTTQTPTSSAHQGCITIYEMNNAAGGYPTEVHDFAAATAVAETPKATKTSGGIVLGVFVNRSTTGPTSLTGTNVTADAAGNITGVGRAVAPFHITPSVAGNNGVTANYGTAQAGCFMALSVG